MMVYDTAGEAELHKNVSRNPKIMEAFLFMSRFMSLCSPVANLKQNLSDVFAMGGFCWSVAGSPAAP